MAYRRDGGGMGGGALPETTKTWLWGFLSGAIFASAGLTLLRVLS